MYSPDELSVLRFTDAQISDVAQLLGLSGQAFHGAVGADERRTILNAMQSVDVAACPGSGKTTLLVAKLALLEQQWRSRSQGICVLSHTNVARQEVESRLGGSGRRLLSYPHFIGTIHGFVNEFLALPHLRSKGYPITRIDDDWCRRDRWSRLPPDTRVQLTKCNHGPEALVFSTPDGDLRPIAWGKGKLGKDTNTYKQMKKACIASMKDGFFCHHEMLLAAESCISKVPTILVTIRGRFPIVFLDEAQDNDEEQSGILWRLFCEGPNPAIRQRFGDANQAIFHKADADVHVMTDPFPGQPVVSLPSSPRFGPELARLADPLAVSPQGLLGQGPQVPLASAATPQHTIFLFKPEATGNVLDAFGQLLVDTFSADELQRGTFAAVGQVHRRPEAENPANMPQHVGHYWPSYAPERSTREQSPRCFPEGLLSAIAAAAEQGESFVAIDRIASMLVRFANSPSASLSVRRKHQLLLELLRPNPTGLKAYIELVEHFVVRREAVTVQAWASRWKASVRGIVNAIPGSTFAQSPAGENFLDWHEEPSQAAVPSPTTTQHGNLYAYPHAEPKVHIRIGSIHSAKGETHTATLLLETRWHDHNIEALLPWLDGRKRGKDNKTRKRDAIRLKLHYVGMTRPTHLLGVALRRSTVENGDGSLDTGAIGRLQQQGWRILEVGHDKGVPTPAPDVPGTTQNDLQ